MMDIRLKALCLLGVALVAGISCAAYCEPIPISSRLEPMVDDWLIESMEGVALKLNKPVPREVAIVFDAPWEGSTCCYVTVFEDDGLFRMYYRGSHYDVATKTYSEKQRVCYAQSTDGILWEKPELGLFEFEGSKANNIIWEGVGCHNFAPFKDANPNCKPEAKYKAVASGEDHARLVPFQSPDAIHWSLIQEDPVITEGAFDSQNLAFWDTFRGRYVEFHRGFRDGVRDIMTSTSEDFIHWTQPEWLDFGDAPREHLYTNAITAYARAPHIFMGFPKRFVPSRDPKVHPFPGISDGVFMTSRDGFQWHRWQEALVRPGLQKTRWVNRNNMTAWGILQTKSSIPDTPDELSIYSTEGYYVGPCKLRRFTVRLDGFVSVNAPGKGGEFTTKTLTFEDDPAVTGPDIEPHVVAVDADAAIGAKSLRFTSPAIITLPGTQNLGPKATLAVAVRDVPAGHRRLFSAYDGGAIETTQNELWFDMDSDGNVGDSGTSIRVGAHGEMVAAETEAVGNWSTEAGDHDVHHIAATWDDGVVTIYFDGKQVAQGGTPGRGDFVFMHGDLQFGEDYPPASQDNEPFLGIADDLLVLRRVLSPEEIEAIAQQGAATLKATAADGDILYTFEGDERAEIANALNDRGEGNTLLPGPRGPAETQLIINYSTSAAGSIRCAILDETGAPLPGYAQDDSDDIFGDHVERAVTWRGDSELKGLVGKPVRLRFVMKDADLYSIRFR